MEVLELVAIAKTLINAEKRLSSFNVQNQGTSQIKLCNWVVHWLL